MMDDANRRAEQIFSHWAGADESAEPGIDEWSPGLWRRMADSDLLPWWRGERHDQAGEDLQRTAEILRAVGKYAAPIPLADTAVACWLLSAVDIAPGAPLHAGVTNSGVMTVVPGHPDDSIRVAGDRVSGVAHRVPFGRVASTVVHLAESDGRSVVAAVPMPVRDSEDDGRVAVDVGENMAGEPRDTLTFHDCPCIVRAAPDWLDEAALFRRGALVRALLMGGALHRLSDLTIEHCANRTQFGRTLVSFQAVQAHIVAVAEAAATVDLASRAAVDRVAVAPSASFEIAALKLLANEAAITAARSAHQAHGAIGLTRRHSLQRLTRRLWSWSTEYGNRRYWATVLAATAGSDANGLFNRISG